MRQSVPPIRPRNDEIINYLLRPAKNIERKMLCEAIARLTVIAPLKQYQYVGFGSTYFADFILFHKHLGIHKLISIEGESEMETRIRFNIPYSCIEVKCGPSTDMLPEIDWENHKSILWLDYTETLKSYMFNDMATFFNRAVSGSLFVISINVDLKDESDGKTTSEKILKKLSKDVDVRKKIHSSSLKAGLNKNDYYSILHSTIHQEILDIISIRNKTEQKEKFTYKQIFNFLYKDGQAMLTIGGIIYGEKDEQKISKMDFNDLEFVRNGNEYFEINVPNLTYPEIKAIHKFLPNFSFDQTARENAFNELKGIVSSEAIEKYARIYRYFPIFAESHL